MEALMFENWPKLIAADEADDVDDDDVDDEDVDDDDVDDEEEVEEEDDDVPAKGPIDGESRSRCGEASFSEPRWPC